MNKYALGGHGQNDSERGAVLVEPEAGAIFLGAEEGIEQPLLHLWQIGRIDTPLWWRESTNGERLHEANGLMLTPTADHLFDRGFISFEDDGGLLISPVADALSLRRMGVDPSNPPRRASFSTDQKHFLAHHRQEIFLAAAE